VTLPLYLLKFTKTEYVTSMRKGRLWLKPLAFYQEHYEGAPVGQIDPNEGLSACYQPEYARLLLNGVSIAEFHSPIKVRQKLPTIFAFCALAVTKKDIECNPTGFSLDERLRAFGEKVVVITDFDKFQRRVNSAVNNCSIRSVPGLEGRISGLVEYVPRNYHGEMGPFRKFDEFAYQREWRLAFIAENCLEDHFVLDVGNLDDITLEVPSSGGLEFSW